MKLTDQSVRSLPHPESGQRDYPDAALTGFMVRVGKRTKTFMLVTGTGKHRKRHTIGRYDPPHFTLAMARDRARDLCAEDRLSKIDVPRTTFTEALETYYRVHISTLRRQSQRGITQTINRRFRPRLAKKALTDIKPGDIAPLLDTMLDTPTEMHNAFVYLSMFLNWCMRRGYIESVPTARMQTPKRPASRDRVLSGSELAAIWNAADPETDYGRICRLAILSGQRIGQWAAIRREYIQGGMIVWPAAAMKIPRAHALPLTATMRALLPDRIGYLFPTAAGVPFNSWSRSKDRLDEQSGVENFRHHDFRRSWATIAAEELDILPHIVDAVLAHASGTSVSRTYNRAKYLLQMREALMAFEAWLMEQLKHSDAPNLLPPELRTA